MGPFPGSVSVLLGGPGGRFTGPTPFSAGQTPQSVAVGDFNADSRPDLAVANFNSADVSVLLGDGKGGFTDPTNYSAGDPQSVQPNSVAAGDFNADGHLDLAVANDVYFGSVVVLLGRGDGSFGGPTSFPVDIPYPRSVVAGNFNPGTPLDLAVAYTVSSSVGLMYGQGDGTFTGPTDVPAGDDAMSVAVGDLNHDARPDLAVANGATDQVSVLLNTTASCAGRAATIEGSPGADRLAGTRRSDVIVGGPGRDRLRGAGATIASRAARATTASTAASAGTSCAEAGGTTASSGAAAATSCAEARATTASPADSAATTYAGDAWPHGREAAAARVSRAPRAGARRALKLPPLSDNQSASPRGSAGHGRRRHRAQM